jgi:Cu+-exporting ATPase
MSRRGYSPVPLANTAGTRGNDLALTLTPRPPDYFDLNSPLASPTPDSDESVAVIKVDGLTIPRTAAAITELLRSVAGITNVDVDSGRGTVSASYDAHSLRLQTILSILKKGGYTSAVATNPIMRSDTGLSMAIDEKKESPVAITTVAIQGMTCGACTSAVESGFKGAPGILNFNISLLAERAIITHDTNAYSAEKILAEIDDRGFDCQLLSSVVQGEQLSKAVSSAVIKVFGLTDSASARALETDLRGILGVSSAIVDLSSSKITVTFLNSACGLRTIVETIESKGYNALVGDADENNAQLESLAKTREIQEWRSAFKFSLSFAIPVFLITMICPMYLPFLDVGRLQTWVPGLYWGDLICLCLTIPVQFGIGFRFYKSAWKSLRHWSPTMDVLVVMGTSAGFFFSLAAMVVSVMAEPHNRPGTVWDTSTMLITFITLGRFLENRAKGQTSRALSRLMSLAPSMASIYVDPVAAEKAADITLEPKGADSSTMALEEKIIPTELLQAGDVVIIRPGDKIPADGRVIRGESHVDESMVTGESMPILKKLGSHLIAGTVNGAGRLDFRVTRAGKDTQLSQIVNLVQEAQTSRAPIQRMADLVAGYFVPAILTLGLVTFVGWMVLSHILPHPPAIFLSEAAGGRIMVCVKLCISVIVFACPCALGLSTPTAVMVGTGVGAENGILVKGGAALETATKITMVVLDKTGTLTVGQMSVSAWTRPAEWDQSAEKQRLWWTILGLAEMSSEHPVARAIVSASKDALGMSSEGAFDGSIGNFEAVVGKGVAVFVDVASEKKRFKVHVGNAEFLHNSKVELPEEILATISVNEDSTATAATAAPSAATSRPSSRASLESRSSLDAVDTNVFLAIDGVYAGSLSLADAIKTSALPAILALHKLGLRTAMVTGDTARVAYSVAAAVGIPAQSVWASASPDQKQRIVKDLQASGEVIAMVGDGINDSPALATAAVGIAMSSGTDVAMEAADIVLMRPDSLLDVPAALSLARSIFHRIKLNLLWACVYNVIGLPFAMGLLLPWGWHLHPMAAAAAMALSSVSVVCSSLLLKFWTRPAWMHEDRLLREKDSIVVNPLREEPGRLARAAFRLWDYAVNIVLRRAGGAGGKNEVRYERVGVAEV